MRDLVLFVFTLNCYWRLQFGIFGAAQPAAFNFANNYTYRIFHTYNYEYKDPTTNGEYIPNSNYPQSDPKEPIPIAQRNHFNTNNYNGEHFYDPENTNRNFKPNVWTPSNLPHFIEQHETITNQPRKSRENINRGNTETSFLTVNGSKCAYGFCEQAENYPEALLFDLVKNNAALSAFFKPAVPVVVDRAFPSFENICEVTVQRMTPKTAQNVEGKNRIVVNLKEYKQIVESEVCRKDATCKFHNYWPEGYKAKCIQKYVEVPLAVMDDMENKIIVEKFSYPSGCYCACKNE
ncbi:uncharacterized protein [Onthophagus taurus]|uniref:uncharacterized protein n=1 Tax=Onthophagus taurus TaxID=166361 RepID=UPI000C20F029|nr:uncharacterized protein LOC111422405 [Onthophagus taurus]